MGLDHCLDEGFMPLRENEVIPSFLLSDFSQFSNVYLNCKYPVSHI